jgi:hypothetical protein
VLTMGTNCPNELFCFLVDLRTNWAQYGLETWFSPNDDIRVCLLDMQRCWSKKVPCNLNRRKWREWCIFVSLFLFNKCFGLLLLTIASTYPNQVFYVWLADLQSICDKYELETWLSPNDGIRKCLLVMQRSWTQNAPSGLNNKKWHKSCKFESPFLFNNAYCFPVLSMGTKCRNQVFYVWLIDLQTICAKCGLETLLFPSDDSRKFLLDMHRSWNQNAFCDGNNKKWRKWCKLVSPCLFNNPYGLPEHTKCSKCPNQVFYVWLVDLQIICAK